MTDAAPPAGLLHADAIAALRAGRAEAGLAAIVNALALAPHDPALLNDAAAIAQAAKAPYAALDFMNRAVAAQPAEWRYRANLAVLNRQMGNLEASLACLDAAQHAAPASAELAHQRGLTLARMGDAASALAQHRRALAVQPGWFEAEVGVATALQDLDRHDEAVALYRDVIAREPRLAAAHNNLGRALLNLPDPHAALACFDHAIALAPHQAEIHYNRALTLLALGRYREGWIAHAARRCMAQPPSPRRSFEAMLPRWDGTPLAGRRLLLHAEQGLGDTIQFLRFVGMARAMGRTTCGTVILEVHRQLHRLAQRLCSDGGADLVAAQGPTLPAADLHLPLMDLPLVLDSGDKLDCGRPAYLAPAVPQRRRAGVPRVGLVWAGNPAHSNDRRRSMPCTHLAAIVAGSTARFTSLQPGHMEDLAALAAGRIVVAALPPPADLMQTAERIAGLDLVISVDTSVAHLAAAMGVPTWLLVPFIPDWRWGYGRTTTPWYPTMRLFRQPRPGDWAAVGRDVRAALDGLCLTGADRPGAPDQDHSRAHPTISGETETPKPF